MSKLLLDTEYTTTTYLSSNSGSIGAPREFNFGENYNDNGLENIYMYVGISKSAIIYCQHIATH